MFEYVMSTESHNRGQEVVRLQTALRCMGYSAGASDGIFGRQTKAAVALYQQDHGLPVTGVASPPTLRQLSIEVLPGIDVSGWQRGVKWASVKDAGVRFVCVKATEGTTKKATRGLFEHIEGLLSAGIEDWSLYHFALPNTHAGAAAGPGIGLDARQEAESFLRIRDEVLVRFGAPTLPAWIDVEKGVNEKKTAAEDDYNADWVGDFNDVLVDAGVFPAVYTARWAFNAFLRKAKPINLARVTALPLVLADYDGFPDDEVAPWKEWAIWQYSGHGKCPGVKGDCDLLWMAGGAMDVLRGRADNGGW